MIKLIRYHHPPYVKHVLAPQNEFGTQKILGQFTKVLGIGKTPPPCWEKFPNNPVFFLSAYLSKNVLLVAFEPEAPHQQTSGERQSQSESQILTDN